MSTATQSLGGPIRAGQAVVGQKYIRRTPTGKLVEVEVEGKRGNKVVLKVDDPDFDETIEVSETFTLHKIEDLSPAKPAPKSAPKSSSKTPAPKPSPKPSSLPKKQRMEKVADGKAAPRVKLEGFDLRQFYRNRLAINRAVECENAKKHSCRCRCGGALHGKSHKPWFEAEAALFEKSSISAITAKDVLGLIKKFGGAKFLAEHKSHNGGK